MQMRDKRRLTRVCSVCCLKKNPSTALGDVVLVGYLLVVIFIENSGFNLDNALTSWVAILIIISGQLGFFSYLPLCLFLLNPLGLHSGNFPLFFFSWPSACCLAALFHFAISDLFLASVQFQEKKNNSSPWVLQGNINSIFINIRQLKSDAAKPVYK